jgi:hypothetical protein
MVSWPTVRSLLAAAVLFAGIVTFVGACGTDDLVFPGMAAPTSPPVNTATPEPDDDV